MSYITHYNHWLNSPALSEAEKAELREIADDAKEIESRFFGRLEFGTGGLRGIMGVGLYKMNIHIVRHTTQALAELILAEPGLSNRTIVIAYDSRNNSREFAREAACVMAGNGVHVKLFNNPTPTPQLSFAIRHYGAISGINITASHNPKEYNGYKVYWSDGAQLPPHHAKVVAEKMDELDIFTSIKSADFDKSVENGLITTLAPDIDELFLKNVMAQVSDFDSVTKVADSFRLVYTPFHGGGGKLVPEAFRRLGLKHIHCVAEQMIPDGNFPTVISPNPEDPEGFELSIALAEQHCADLIIGTDPDVDRVGIMVRNDKNKFIALTGNQTGVLLLDYIISAKIRAGTMPEKPIILKTIVTSEMARRITDSFKLPCYDTFTGFKFMAEKKNALEASGQGHVVFSYEESYGYMAGDFARDKDAVTASTLIAEMAAWYAVHGITLYTALLNLYEKYGNYGEHTLNLMMPGLDGLNAMRELMTNLRENPPSHIADVSVTTIRDYLGGIETDTQTKRETKIELSGSNVLRFILEDGSVVIARPSGTEPKIKIYLMVSGDTREECDAKLQSLEKWTATLR